MRIASYLAAGMLGICTPVAAQIPHNTSGQFDFGMEVTPIPGTPGEYLLKVTVADAQSGHMIVNPGFRIAKNESVAFTLGEEPDLTGVACIGNSAPHGWCINVVAGANGNRKHAAFEAVVTHSGKITSRHRFRVRLDG